MARRSRYNRRRRQGRFSFLYRILVFVAICGAIAVALALFFKVDKITVTGNSRYTAKQIVEAAGIQTGDNMFFLNKYHASEQITAALPYVETVRISRQLPDTLVVAVTECTAPAAVQQEGKLWLLSGDGKIVDSKTIGTNTKYAMVKGLSLLEPQVGAAIQVSEELSKLAVHKRGVSVLPIYGGQPIERQLRALAKGAQVVVGTPGRVIDHLQRGTLRLNEARIVVLDEADEMLDMGFREDIELILEQSPADCQRVLFSATMPQPIRELSKRFLREPEMLTIAHKMLTVPAIEQVYYEVRPYQKMDALCRVLDSQGFRKALVFCATKRSVDEITVHLQQRGYQADGLHGDMNQTQRDRVMSRFRTDGIEILVATDVAARGIDVDDVDAVINYDIPHDVEGYVHRIGRTGRAGREGKAFTFVTVREQYKIREIIRYTKARIQPGQLPTLRDVSNIRTSKLLDEVRQTLAESSLDRWRILVEDFQTEHFPDGDASSRDISAALLKLLMQRDFGNQDNVGEVDELTMAPQRPAKNAEAKSKGRMQPLPRRQESGPMSRLHIDVGQAHDVTPRALVGAITGESGIPGRSVGAIDIQNNFSIVEISAELAAHVLATLNKGVFISGVKVSAKAADETDSPHPRKPFAPGQRRQRPGKFGKKPRGATLGRKAYSESR